MRHALHILSFALIALLVTPPTAAVSLERDRRAEAVGMFLDFRLADAVERHATADLLDRTPDVHAFIQQVRALVYQDLAGALAEAGFPRPAGIPPDPVVTPTLERDRTVEREATGGAVSLGSLILLARYGVNPVGSAVASAAGWLVGNRLHDLYVWATGPSTEERLRVLRKRIVLGVRAERASILAKPGR